MFNYRNKEIILFYLISENRGDNQSGGYQQNWSKYTLFFDFALTVKQAPHECVIRIGQP